MQIARVFFIYIYYIIIQNIVDNPTIITAAAHHLPVCCTGMSE